MGKQMFNKMQKFISKNKDSIISQFTSKADAFLPDPLSIEDRIYGCLYGGAVGDALGYIVEFDSISTIRKNYGTSGVSMRAISLVFPIWERCLVSDDTQMTMFTAEGVLVAHQRWGDRLTSERVLDCIRDAYLDWYLTQQTSPSQVPVGHLGHSQLMRANRAPGMTCLSACKAGAIGTVERPLNDSMGCGGVMRVAPIGFLHPSDPAHSFTLGVKAAAMTHGHPMGYIPAGALSWLINRLAQGESMKAAVFELEEYLRGVENAGLMRTLILSAMKIAPISEIAPEHVEVLGGGWVGHECLAIAILAALADVPLERKFEIAVNHSGDSDSTAAVLGNLIGAEVGHRALLEVPAYRSMTSKMDVAPLLEPLVKDFSDLIQRSLPAGSATDE
jgi:ADP-ribosylglycohydrolase